jgi:hypothetical protein
LLRQSNIKFSLFQTKMSAIASGKSVDESKASIVSAPFTVNLQWHLPVDINREDWFVKHGILYMKNRGSTDYKTFAPIAKAGDENLTDLTQLDAKPKVNVFDIFKHPEKRLLDQYGFSDEIEPCQLDLTNPVVHRLIFG